MESIMIRNRLLSRSFLTRVLALLVLALAGAGAIAQTDPPARVASLSHIEGSVVLAPAGDTEWTDAVLNRPITRDDRLWTDPGGRAEVHLGSAVLHMDGETFLGIAALDDQVLQASLNEGAVNARVRQLEAGENFEIDTPQLAFRASQPGDYRIDVDAARGTTRVTVRSGIALVYGASGEAQQLQAGQQISFAGRDLERVAVQASPLEDGFDRWAAERNRIEDQSIAARYVPRDVVGYQQLDPYGSWAQDPSYGAIWYPRVTVADWAPYRYGHWDWIAPWGWTWIDDAAWGFAPFHYGRWAIVGSRWAWVPGRIGRRPVYAPALVEFIGGGGGRSGRHLPTGSNPGIAWYPLAPGEDWRPGFRTSAVYVRNVNRNIVVNNNAPDTAHVHGRRTEAVTGMRVEDFSRGRPVHSHWVRVNPTELERAQIASPPAMPEPRRFRDAGRATQPRSGTQPPARFPAPAAAGRPRPLMQVPRAEHERPPQFRQEEPRRDEQRRQQQFQQQEHTARDRQIRERVQREQLRVQQERVQRAQQLQAEVHPAPPQRGEARERAAERRHSQEPREDGRLQGDEDVRGRARGQGRGG
jgi:hypothetical protein